MLKFRLPPISPLLGTSLLNFKKVLGNQRIPSKYNIKILITLFLILFGSLFHWLDTLFYKKKVKGFVFEKSPVFIIGHWRSGTTLLHNLLTKDADSGFVTTYHAVFPNNLRSKLLFKTFMRLLMPKRRPGDNLKIAVNLPQEDEYAMSNITHFSYYHSFYFPKNYKKYYESAVRFKSLTNAEVDTWKFEYRRLIIKALLNTHGRRAILKNPVNTGRVLILSEMFLDSHFVFCIRNPINVYLSSKKFFTQLFPSLNLEIFSDTDISNMILETYVTLLNDYILDKKHIRQDKLIEIRFEELQENPVMVMEKIYNKLALPNFQDVRPKILEFLDTQREHNTDTYTIEQEELNTVMQRFDFFMKHWNYDIPDDLVILTDSRHNATYKHTQLTYTETS